MKVLGLLRLTIYAMVLYLVYHESGVWTTVAIGYLLLGQEGLTVLFNKLNYGLHVVDNKIKLLGRKDN